MKKQSLIKGSLILGLAGMLAKVLGFFFRWPLIMLIGDEGIGYYQLSYPLYMFFVAMASGVPIAVSKMISEKNAIGDVKGSYEVVKESSFLMITLGLGTSLILFFFAKPIISFLKWDMKSYYSLIGISFAPMMVSFVTIFRGFFQGLQNMTPSGISQILEQIGRVVIGVGLAYFLFDKGIEYSAGGAAFGAAGGAFVAGIYLVLKYKRVKKEAGIKKVKTNTDLLNKKEEMQNKINIALKLSAVIALPASLGIFCLAGPIMKLIFFDKYEGIEILRYLSISIPFIIVTQTTTSVLQATNYYIRPVVNLIIGCILKVILTAILVPIPKINIFGAVISSVASYMLVTILNLISLKSKTKCNISVYDSFVKPGYASVIMSVVVLFVYEFMMKKIANNSISCLLSVFMGIIIYIISILLFNVFDVNDVKNRLVRK